MLESEKKKNATNIFEPRTPWLGVVSTTTVPRALFHFTSDINEFNFFDPEFAIAAEQNRLKFTRFAQKTSHGISFSRISSFEISSLPVLGQA